MAQAQRDAMTNGLAANVPNDLRNHALHGSRYKSGKACRLNFPGDQCPFIDGVSARNLLFLLRAKRTVPSHFVGNRSRRRTILSPPLTFHPEPTVTMYSLSGDCLASATYCGFEPFNSLDKFLSLIHISEPTRRTPISYAVFC